MIMAWTIWCQQTSLWNRLIGNPYKLAALLAGAGLLWPSSLLAAPVAVRHLEGLVHGFHTLSTLEGKRVAVVDLNQVARCERLTKQLVLIFTAGSIRTAT